MYTLNSANGSCIQKCIQGQENWNIVTKKCDPIRTLGVGITQTSAKVIRCRNSTFTASGVGLLSGETAYYTWSIEIADGGVSKDKWLSDINAIITDANINKVSRFVIPSTLTEKITDLTTLKIITVMTVGKFSATNSSTLIVEPYVFTTITNYTTTYTILASAGLALYPAFMFPECPIFKGPQAIPSGVNIGCSLYDSKNNLIKILTTCAVLPNELSSGLSYYIRYYYSPNPYQVGLTALKDSITVTTIA